MGSMSELTGRVLKLIGIPHCSRQHYEWVAVHTVDEMMDPKADLHGPWELGWGGGVQLKTAPHNLPSKTTRHQ